MNRSIEFVRSWKHYVPGQIVSTFGLGVADILVRRNLAKWVVVAPEVAPVVEAVEQPKPRKKKHGGS